jgi:hypothetical protein
MKLLQIGAVSLLLVVGSVMAFADSIDDPRVIIQGIPGGTAPLTCPQCIGVGVNFAFAVPPSGSGKLFFTNNSGVNWLSLELFENKIPSQDIGNIFCSSVFFSSCTPKTLGSGYVQIFLLGGTGIKAGQSFAISFACFHKHCWPGGLQFNARANTSASVPEPSTIALMMTGLGALISRRKTWKNRWKF